RCASPSTATATQAPTGKDRCLASPHDRLDPNQSLPTQTQKAALPTQFSEEPQKSLIFLARTERRRRNDGTFFIPCRVYGHRLDSQRPPQASPHEIRGRLRTVHHEAYLGQHGEEIQLPQSCIEARAL